MKCKKCKAELGNDATYYMNVQYKHPMRVCGRCYAVVTQGMGGNGWREIKPSECEELKEGLSLLTSLIADMENGQEDST